MNYPALVFAGILLGGLNLRADVVLNEIVSQNNQNGFLAANGQAYDWIELHNTGDEEVDLQGSFLTDDPEIPNKWEFTRSFPIPPGGYAVVFASDRNELISGQEHTNFKLDAGDGEYLALIASDGVTVRDEFSPGFPALYQLHSFGISSPGGEATVLLSATPNAANDEAAPIPVIHSFTASAEVIANGESVTIEWETENGTWVTLDTSFNHSPFVEDSGSTILRPVLNETVTLKARNEFHEARQVIQILVGPAVNAFSATPDTIATGGQTVLRWQTEGSSQSLDLDGFSIDEINSPTSFIPTNLNLIPVDATWKKAPDAPGADWRTIGFDDDGWTDTQLPLAGVGYFRKTFQVDDPDTLAVGALRFSTVRNSIVTLNGETLFDSKFPYGAFREPNGDLRINPALFRAGENVLAIQTTAEWTSYHFQLGAWRSQPVDTIVPVTLRTTNQAGESSRTVNIKVLAEDTPLPPLPTVAISEIFWSYYGTFPVEPYRFFEVQNCGEDPIDLSGIQIIGTTFFAFDDTTDPVLDANGFAVVVHNHPFFSEIWPGDRNVVGQIENPDRPETYAFDFEGALLDSYGRTFEELSSETLPEFGDIYQPYERIDPKAPADDPSNWFIADRSGNWEQGGGSPGEASFRIVDFSFDPPFASPGDSVQLKWEVSREATLEISDGIGPVTGTTGSIDLVVPEDALEFRFWLNATTTFTNHQSLAVLMLPPSVSLFKASKTMISPGEEITFWWNQRIRYVSFESSISPEVIPGIYGGRHTFTPLISGFKNGDYWRTRAHSSAPEADWSSPGFSSSWRIRRGIIGFGDDRVTSALTPNNWLTAHFYRPFDVSDVDEINGLFLDILNDDGIEVYLNGREVLRDNLPVGDIDHLTPALEKTAVRERTFEIDPSYLEEGQNIIAVALHNSSLNDGNLVFDLGLRAQRPVPESGQKTYTYTASNSAGSDSAQVTILFGEPMELSQWQSDNGLTGDASTTDSDGDGLIDYLEFMTGSDPNGKSPHPVTLTRDSDGFISVSHPKNLAAANGELVLESSTDLKTWRTLSDFKFEGSVAPEGSSTAEVRYRSYSAVKEARYFRLRSY